MAGITNDLANDLLEHAMGVSEYAPGMLYAGLLRKTGDVSGFALIGTTALGELSGNGYSRYLLTWGSVSTGGDGRATIVSDSATFTATGTWEPVDGVGLFDDAGQLCWFAYFDSPSSLVNGDTLTAGPFTLRLD